jgi:hypothetical protein
MADSKITALDNLTAADPVNDMFPIVDVSDTTMAASGTTKRISANNILSSSPTASGALTVTGLVTAGSATITGAATVGTTLGVTGVSTLASASITGAATVGTTLGVTGVSSFAAGTALLPSITRTGDTNTGAFFPAADTFAVATGGVEAYRADSLGNLLVGTVTSPAGTKVGAIAKLSGVSVEGTAAINVSTTPVAIGKSLGTGGLFFVTGYNTSGGAQGWWLVASQQAVAPNVIATNNSTGLTVAFTLVLGVVYMNTTSGTIQVNSFAVTN